MFSFEIDTIFQCDISNKFIYKTHFSVQRLWRFVCQHELCLGQSIFYSVIMFNFHNIYNMYFSRNLPEVLKLLDLREGTLGLQPFGSGPSCLGHSNSSPDSRSTAVYKGPCSCPDKGSYLSWCHYYSYRSSCIHWSSNQLRYSLVVDSGLAVL